MPTEDKAKSRLLKRRVAALAKLGITEGYSLKTGLVFGCTTAAKLLGIATKHVQAMLEPVDYVDNPHCRSAGQVARYDPLDLVRVSNQKRVAVARKRCGPKPAKNFVPIFERRYNTRENAVPVTADALWNLNRYAKHKACTDKHREEIYQLKNSLLKALAERGYLRGVGEHTLTKPKMQLECWRCDGLGCNRCNFTGVWRELPELKLKFLVLHYEIDGTIYRFHQPFECLFWKPYDFAPSMGTGTWTPEYEKPITLPASKFSEAKALIRWVLDVPKPEAN